MTLIRLTAIYNEGGIDIGDRLLADDMETLREYAYGAVAHINADAVSAEVTPITSEGEALPRQATQISLDLFAKWYAHDHYETALAEQHELEIAKLPPNARAAFDELVTVEGNSLHSFLRRACEAWATNCDGLPDLED